MSGPRIPFSLNQGPGQGYMAQALTLSGVPGEGANPSQRGWNNRRIPSWFHFDPTNRAASIGSGAPLPSAPAPAPTLQDFIDQLAQIGVPPPRSEAPVEQFLPPSPNLPAISPVVREGPAPLPVISPVVRNPPPPPQNPSENVPFRQRYVPPPEQPTPPPAPSVAEQIKPVNRTPVGNPVSIPTQPAPPQMLPQVPSPAPQMPPPSVTEQIKPVNRAPIGNPVSIPTMPAPPQMLPQMPPPAPQQMPTVQQQIPTGLSIDPPIAARIPGLANIPGLVNMPFRQNNASQAPASSIPEPSIPGPFGPIRIPSNIPFRAGLGL